MENLLAEVDQLLDGQALPVRAQLDLVQEKEFLPLTKVNVGYIVYGIALDDLGQVLMMQEAKPSCYGKWYLPAGRLEPNESLIEGVQREVKEETGMLYKPASLVDVLSVGRSYHRFAFIGEICGGELKSRQNADEESLQGAWVPIEKLLCQDEDYPLRAPDVIDLIKTAQQKREGQLLFTNFLPQENAHKLISLRILLVSSASNKMEILCGNENGLHLPEGEFVGYGKAPLNNLLKVIFTDIKDQLTVYGILSVEYSGQPAHEHDGLCISVLLHLPNKDSSFLKSSHKFEWKPLDNKALETKLMDRLQPHCNIKYSL